MSKSYLDGFSLVGGTALALHIGHRISVDIDLFTLDDFDPDKLFSNLSADFKAIKILTKIKNSLLVEFNDIRTDLIKFRAKKNLGYDFMI